MKCKECSNFKSIANTEETRQGLCGYPMSYFPVCIDNDCVYIPKPYTCKDCDRFANDTACMTADADDPVMQDYGMCGGFIDKSEATLYNILGEWSLRGYDIQDKLNKVIEEFNHEFEIPFQPIDKK